jgi:hypothetical protein
VLSIHPKPIPRKPKPYANVQKLTYILLVQVYHVLAILHFLNSPYQATISLQSNQLHHLRPWIQQTILYFLSAQVI